MIPNLRVEIATDFTRHKTASGRPVLSRPSAQMDAAGFERVPRSCGALGIVGHRSRCQDRASVTAACAVSAVPRALAS